MSEDLSVDPETLREQVRDKYREVAVDPHRSFHFHTGRPLAARLGYDHAAVDALPYAGPPLRAAPARRYESAAGA